MEPMDESFWQSRLSNAVECARTACSERSRSAYLELAMHYRAMHRVVRAAGHPPRSVTKPISIAQGDDIDHNFGSIHDALMEPA